MTSEAGEDGAGPSVDPRDPDATIAALRRGIADLMRAESVGDDPRSAEGRLAVERPVRRRADRPADETPDGRALAGGSAAGGSAAGGSAAGGDADDWVGVGGPGSRGRNGGRRGSGTGRGIRLDEAEPDPEAVARTIVLRRVSERPRTRHELTQILQRRDIPAEVAERVLDRMEEVRLVDDAGYAVSYVESTQQRRHLSRRRLRQDLKRRGVGAEEIEAAVAGVDDDDEYDAARDLAARKLRPIAHLDAVVRRRRIGQALQRRGFAPALIRRVIDDVTADHEQITNITTR